MGCLDVIMMKDFFYQVLIAWNSWIFKSQINGLNSLGINFCHENIKFYELKQVIGQKYTNLIYI